MCATIVAPRDLGLKQQPNSRELRRGMPRSRWVSPAPTAVRSSAARTPILYAFKSRFLPKERPSATRSCCVHRGAPRAAAPWRWISALRRTRNPS
jgi:hypothetical protein